MSIPFNKPYLHGRELVYIADALSSGKIAGDGKYTKKCHAFFEEKYGFQKVLLTTSCTDALEMAAILLDIKCGDEIILPSFTFVSTANAFALRGATLKFADSCTNSPNIDPQAVAKLITPKTKAIIVVHYAGVACDMDAIVGLANEHKIAVVEDAAQAIDSFYKGKPLGSFGTFATFSFHETKNIVAGEAGMLVINDSRYNARAEIIREKGTNRSSFFRGEVDKYGWVDLGSSFLPSDILAAHLYAQLEVIEQIQDKRRAIWRKYYSGLSSLAEKGFFSIHSIPEWATNNAHMFYIICNNEEHRAALLSYLKECGINATFHYLSLSNSAYYSGKHQKADVLNSDIYSDRLLRFPLFYDLTDEEIEFIIKKVSQFCQE